MFKTSINSTKPFGKQFALIPELYVSHWQKYCDEVDQANGWTVLHKRLVQLQFPIKAGISQTAIYYAATRQGIDVSDHPEASGLVLNDQAGLKLCIHQSAAGAVPVLIPATRADFCSLVQAFTKRNEPVPIPDSMGACMVAGYNNWDRISVYREEWLSANSRRTLADWPQAFQELISKKHLYQDRFIILSRGPYSNVPAAALGLDTEKWLSLSLQIRLEHECTHYFTKRLFGVMRRHLHDELLADYAGITAAAGHFRADWFLHFMGLENYPNYRLDGRMKNYLDPEWQEEPAFSKAKAILVAAAHNLERFDQSLKEQKRDIQHHGVILSALASVSLAELAADGGDQTLAAAVTAWQSVATPSI